MVLLFIGESIGWQELFLIGTLALIFLGPRKLPQLAKTIGKTMAEFKNAGQEFRSTWEKEISLEESEKNFIRNPLDENFSDYSSTNTIKPEPIAEPLRLPEVRQISEKDFPQLAQEKVANTIKVSDPNGKQDWL